MKIIVFGATGATGRQLIEQALAAGHQVTAFVRTPSKLALTHDRLRVVQGDVLRPETVDAALPGHDVVLIALGTRLSGDDQTISRGTHNILTAMRTHGVTRVIVESAWGVGDSQCYGGFLLNHIVRPFFLKHPFAEHELQEQELFRSDTEWTAVRPGRLTNGPKTRTLRGARTPDGLSQKVSRAEVASFMLDEAAHPAHARQAILIG